jgi:hypothetical protein
MGTVGGLQKRYGPRPGRLHEGGHGASRPSGRCWRCCCSPCAVASPSSTASPRTSSAARLPPWCAHLVTTQHTSSTNRPQPFLALVLALCHSLRHPSQRQYPAWSADSRPRTFVDRILNFLYDGSTRYILPAALLSVSSFLVLVKTSTLRSTYICPIANSTATTIPTLQFFGFMIDCFVVSGVFRLIDDGISPADDWTIYLQDGTSNHLLVGLTLVVRFPLNQSLCKR